METPPTRTWAQWLDEITPSFLKPAPPAPTTGTIADTTTEGAGGRKRKSKKTRRGGKKSRKLKPRRK